MSLLISDPAPSDLDFEGPTPGAQGYALGNPTYSADDPYKFYSSLEGAQLACAAKVE